MLGSKPVVSKIQPNKSAHQDTLHILNKEDARKTTQEFEIGQINRLDKSTKTSRRRLNNIQHKNDYDLERQTLKTTKHQDRIMRYTKTDQSLHREETKQG